MGATPARAQGVGQADQPRKEMNKEERLQAIRQPANMEVPDRNTTRISIVAYLKPRSATLVVYVPGNYYRAVTVKTSRAAAERVLAFKVRRRWQVGRVEGVSVKVPFESVAPLLVGNRKLMPTGRVDALFKEAYRRSEEVQEILRRRALERMHGDEEAAEAYIKAWLKAENFTLPPDDPDAREASKANPTVVYGVGHQRYNVQVPPWA